MLLIGFLAVEMLEWRERERERLHEAYDLIVAIDANTMLAFRECELANFLIILGMRAPLELLDYLVRRWDVNEQNFQIGSRTLIIEVEDIYFLIGLS